MKEKVYLTFQLNREESEFLKFFAHTMKKTQPELIEEICKDFIEQVKKYLDEQSIRT